MNIIDLLSDTTVQNFFKIASSNANLSRQLQAYVMSNGNSDIIKYDYERKTEQELINNEIT